nr:hypothetical protein [Tanacetum cinerariifolium]
MVRDSVQLETAVNTISYEYLSDFTSEYGIPETLHPELPGPGDRIVDFSEGKDGMPANGTYFVEDARTLDTHLPLLTLTATRVVEMDEPAVATDSSGVPSTIERSPLNFAHETEASGRVTAAPKVPPPEDVPTTTALGADQAVLLVLQKSIAL